MLYPVLLEWNPGLRRSFLTEREIHSAASSTASRPNQTLAEAGSLPTDVNRRAWRPAGRLMAPRSIEPPGRTRPLYRLMSRPRSLPVTATRTTPKSGTAVARTRSRQRPRRRAARLERHGTPLLGSAKELAATTPHRPSPLRHVLDAHIATVPRNERASTRPRTARGGAPRRRPGTCLSQSASFA